MSLSVKKINALNLPGYYSDGGNLYLQVSKALTKSWLFIYKRSGKKREVGLGSYPLVSLAEAREKALEYRKLLVDGKDPLHERRTLDKPKIITFEECGRAYVEAHRAGWKNEKHANQWTNTLTTYAYTHIGAMPVGSIETKHIVRVLEPIWLTKNETASRLRGRIENILGFATVHGYRTGDNPARWRGHLDKLLSSPAKTKKVEHFKALMYRDAFGLVKALRANGSISALALEFLILTAARTNEVIGATWDEMHIDGRLWIIPGSRMKKEKEHRVPLSERAFQILMFMYETRQNNFIFPGRSRSGGLSNAAMDKLLQVTLGYDCTVHGMRSMFRDWAAETTNFPQELCEMALSHAIKNQAEAAYRRGDMIEKRRVLMQAWEDFISREPSTGDIVDFRKVAERG
ncbi:integrase arm-type DNA-binding domain-containing protein [Methylotuvimicrobium sp. KM2]|uniref:tyrosine-type recombinase/integrase n=1 Tax=Methylotuvimicrobium sp. KM2 TaxID=3133976 RepID=UPI003101415B